MGMDYIPVYEGDDQDDDNTVKVSLDRIQRSGVRMEKVQLRTVVRAIRAPASYASMNESCRSSPIRRRGTSRNCMSIRPADT